MTTDQETTSSAVPCGEMVIPFSGWLQVPPSIPVSQHGECVDDLCSGSAAQDAVPESDQVVPTYPSRGRSWRVVEE
jgi:hypothetical protein